MATGMRRAIAISTLVLASLANLGGAGAGAAPTPGAQAPAPAGCRGLAHRLLVPTGTSQLLTVEVVDHHATSATAQAWSREPGGCFVAVGPPLPAFVGWRGTSTAKREGDGTTPVGVFRLGARLFELGDPLPGAERHQAITCGSWWDEDPASPTYNRFVQLPCGQQPSFRGGSEALWTEHVAYQHLVQIRYNADPAVPGYGSGIFLHDGTGGPTAGCVSLEPGTLELVLSWLDPARRPLIAIGTRADLTGA
jgi:L,D-peptidoglycan transpeptidase YkuD (ErfK/YbiS/YcfS/YnhG family)